MEFLLSIAYLHFEIYFLLVNAALLAVFLCIEIGLVLHSAYCFLFPKGRQVHLEEGSSIVRNTESMAPSTESSDEAVSSLEKNNTSDENDETHAENKDGIFPVENKDGILKSEGKKEDVGQENNNKKKEEKCSSNAQSIKKGDQASEISSKNISSETLEKEGSSNGEGEVLSSLNNTLSEQDSSKETEWVTASLSHEKRHELSELIKHVRTKLARAEFSEARARIIEGLAIDKWNKELNYLLASIYERDKDYKKAEFIYKDLVLVHDTDPEIYMKLGFALSIQGKYEIAFEIYKRILTLVEAHSEALEMLANLAHELQRYEDAVVYSRLFLRGYPHSADMLSVLASSLIALSRRSEALEVIGKLKNLDPYNPRIREMKEKVELELELEKKFQATDIDTEKDSEQEGSRA